MTSSVITSYSIHYTKLYDAALLELLLDDPYFGLEPPKSTGRERFNAAWLRSRLERLPETPADVDIAATLLELTARSITGTIAALDLEEPELIVCGGGAWNETLMKRLGELGGRVDADPARAEVGTCDIRLTDAGRDDSYNFV